MKWEQIETGKHETWRLQVPGGWLYHVKPTHADPSMCFVPFTQQGPQSYNSYGNFPSFNVGDAAGGAS